MVSSIHKKCKFCQKLEIRENVLCHLNRCLQKPSEFKCQAFHPLLKLVDSSDTKDPVFDAHPPVRLRTESIKRFFQSDKIKSQVSHPFFSVNGCKTYVGWYFWGQNTFEKGNDNGTHDFDNGALTKHKRFSHLHTPPLCLSTGFVTGCCQPAQYHYFALKNIIRHTSIGTRIKLGVRNLWL